RFMAVSRLVPWCSRSIQMPSKPIRLVISYSDGSRKCSVVSSTGSFRWGLALILLRRMASQGVKSWTKPPFRFQDDAAALAFPDPGERVQHQDEAGVGGADRLDPGAEQVGHGPEQVAGLHALAQLRRRLEEAFAGGRVVDLHVPRPGPVVLDHDRRRR